MARIIRGSSPGFELLPVRDQPGLNMRLHPRNFRFNAVLTALVGLLVANRIAAADSPPTSSPGAHPAAGAATARVDCDRRLVRCTVTVNNNLPALAGRAPRNFQLREVWRYSTDTKQWRDVTPRNILPVEIRATGTRTANSSNTSQVLFELPQIIGLYHLRWMEDDQRYEGSAIVGPTLCNDIFLKEPPPPGSYAGCWPLARGAMAGYVPNPPPPRDPR